MNFKVLNEENIKVIVEENNNEIASATCYYINTPKVDGKNIGCVGEFECKDKEVGIQLLKKCEEILKEKNVSLIVSPMNGNTWKKYRTMKYTNGDPLFLLENINPIEHNDIFLEAGYKELYTYSSNKGLIENAYTSDAFDVIEKELESEDIKIRKFNKDNPMEDLKKIYNVSKVSFERNPLYTPIEEKEFIEQYQPYINMVDEDLILIAEKEGKEIGFVFCIPNFNELKEGKKLSTLILKTIAVLPEYEHLGLGNILLNRITKVAKEKDFKEWIFAFMYSNNTSQKMAKRNNAEVIREYAIYGKEI